MAVCNKIAAGLAFDCANPPIAGVKDYLYLVNQEDWDNATITRDNSNPELITNIVLASGKLAYKFEGKNNSIEPSSELVPRAYSDTYKHMVNFKVFENTAAAKDLIEKLSSGRYVAILENNQKGTAGNQAFEVYGNDAGLKATEVKRVVNDADTQGAYSLILSTPEKSSEAHLPATVFTTSYSATKAIVDGLIS